MKTILEIIWTLITSFVKGFFFGMTIMFRRFPVKSVWEHYDMIQKQSPIVTPAQRKWERISWWFDRYTLSKRAITMYTFLWSLVFVPAASTYSETLLFTGLCFLINHIFLYSYSNSMIQDAKNKREALEMVYPDLFR